MHLCAIHNGTLKCWGVNTDGELGDNTTLEKSTPVTVVGVPANISHIGSGWYNTFVW